MWRGLKYIGPPAGTLKGGKRVAIASRQPTMDTLGTVYTMDTPGGVVGKRRATLLGPPNYQLSRSAAYASRAAIHAA